MIEKTLLELSLYNPLEIKDDELTDTISVLFLNNEDQFDSYCIECSKESTFKFFQRNNTLYRYGYHSDGQISRGHLTSFPIPIQLVFSCQRNQKHKFTFIFETADSEIIKIGQYPSSASIDLVSIQKYRKVLKQDYEDFSRAIGLYSHGVGAGSFVYLRRIFENLIEEKRVEASKGDSWDEETFQRERMDGKIKLLEKLLPSILVENRKLYSILSKGIHRLSEKECRDLFPDVKLAIELILDEKIYMLDQQSKIQSVKNFVSTTVEKLRS